MGSLVDSLIPFIGGILCFLIGAGYIKTKPNAISPKSLKLMRIGGISLSIFSIFMYIAYGNPSTKVN